MVLVATSELKFKSKQRKLKLLVFNFYISLDLFYRSQMVKSWN